MTSPLRRVLSTGLALSLLTLAPGALAEVLTLPTTGIQVELPDAGTRNWKWSSSGTFADISASDTLTLRDGVKKQREVILEVGSFVTPCADWVVQKPKGAKRGAAFELDAGTLPGWHRTASWSTSTSGTWVRVCRKFGWREILVRAWSPAAATASAARAQVQGDLTDVLNSLSKSLDGGRVADVQPARDSSVTQTKVPKPGTIRALPKTSLQVVAPDDGFHWRVGTTGGDGDLLIRHVPKMAAVELYVWHTPRLRCDDWRKTRTERASNPGQKVSRPKGIGSGWHRDAVSWSTPDKTSVTLCRQLGSSALQVEMVTMPPTTDFDALSPMIEAVAAAAKKAGEPSVPLYVGGPALPGQGKAGEAERRRTAGGPTGLPVTGLSVDLPKRAGVAWDVWGYWGWSNPERTSTAVGTRIIKRVKDTDDTLIRVQVGALSGTCADWMKRGVAERTDGGDFKLQGVIGAGWQEDAVWYTEDGRQRVKACAEYSGRDLQVLTTIAPKGGGAFSDSKARALLKANAAVYKSLLRAVTQRRYSSTRPLSDRAVEAIDDAKPLTSVRLVRGNRTITLPPGGGIWRYIAPKDATGVDLFTRAAPVEPGTEAYVQPINNPWSTCDALMTRAGQEADRSRINPAGMPAGFGPAAVKRTTSSGWQVVETCYPRTNPTMLVTVASMGVMPNLRELTAMMKALVGQR